MKVVGGIFGSLSGIIGLVWGIASLVMSIVFLLPLLGWLNWIVIPFAVIGLIFSVLAMSSEVTRTLGKAGLILGCAAIGIAIFRLVMGGGVI